MLFRPTTKIDDKAREIAFALVTLGGWVLT
jgi:hypothetical protein